MQRFRTAVKGIAETRSSDSVANVLSRFLASLTDSERASIEEALGYGLSSDSGHIASVAYDLTRSELKMIGDAELKSLIAETAQVYIVACNRLAQLSAQ